MRIVSLIPVPCHGKPHMRHDRSVTMVRTLSSWMLLTLMAITLMCTPLAAHEIRPSTGDIEVTRDVATLSLRVNLEALMAGIDLSAYPDTSDAPEAAAYDGFRELTASDLREAFLKAPAPVLAGIHLTTDGTDLPLEIVSVSVPDGIDPTLPRDSILIVRATLPAGEAPVTVFLDPRFGAIALRQTGESVGDDAYTGYLVSGAKSEALPRGQALTEGTGAVFLRYIKLGYTHILPKGLDHILFVLGLFLFSTRLRPLLVQVTAFTLAHTVTLALASLKIVTISPAVVEPLIALSIAFVAIENILWQRLTIWRTVIIFCFGLLHGLGFATVLGELGLSPAYFVTGLIAFNIGVEIGQLSVITLAYFALSHWTKNEPWHRSAVVIPLSLGIATIGLWWAFERTFLS